MNPFGVVCRERGEFAGKEIGYILKARGGMKFLKALKKEYDISPPNSGHRKDLYEALLDITEMLEK